MDIWPLRLACPNCLGLEQLPVLSPPPSAGGYSPSLAGFARLKQELEATLAVASIDLATRAILRNPYRRQAMHNSKLRSSLTPQTSAG
jgi:hypothetical protein